MEQEIIHLIEELKDGNETARKSATLAFGKMKSPQAVTALVQAVKGDYASYIKETGPAKAATIQARGKQHQEFRLAAIQALIKVGEIWIIKQYIEVCCDDIRLTNFLMARSFGEYTDFPLWKQLTELRDNGYFIFESAFGTLKDLGEVQSLPYRVLAEKQLTTAQKIEALETLSKVRDMFAPSKPVCAIPDIRKFCQKAMKQNDAAIREGASAVLEQYGSTHSEQEAKPYLLARLFGRK